MTFVFAEHISPVLKKLSVLHNFTIESQVQMHGPLAFEPRALEAGGKEMYGLTQEDLTVFVNSAEWTLCKFPSPCFRAYTDKPVSFQCLK